MRDLGRRIGVLNRGHFDVGGIHTELIGSPAQYLKCAKSLYQASRTIATLATEFGPDTIVAPAVGGVPLATAVAMELDLPLSVADRGAAGQFRRLRGASASVNMVLVDSTFHSGRTLREVGRLIESLGGRVVGAVVAVRSHVIGQEFNTTVSSPPIRALHEISVHAWSPDECPYCLAQVPLDPRPAVYEGNGH